MKNTNNKQITKTNVTPVETIHGADTFFADPVDLREEVRSQTLEAFTRLLL
jgi:hypothetical protein